MPPDPHQIVAPHPSDRGPDAYEWLAHHGVEARNPPIRSSDYALARACPFAYYLRVRLGLTPADDYTEAASLGALYHACMERVLAKEPPTLDAAPLLDDLQARLTEGGYGGEATKSRMERLEGDIHIATAWADASSSIVQMPNYQVLGTEVLVQAPATTSGYRHAVAARFDALLYDERRAEVWVLDWKTHTGSATARASVCPWEFQTSLYAWLLDFLMRNRVLHDMFDLPTTARAAGVCHHILSKPTIRIRKKDIDAHGWLEARRIYAERCREWLLGEGEFIDKAAARLTDPCINVSWWRPDFASLRDDPEFDAQMAEAIRWASIKPWPQNFPRTGRHLLDGFGPNGPDGLLAYAPFYAAPVRDWPTIISRGWLQDFRDLELDTA